MGRKGRRWYGQSQRAGVQTIQRVWISSRLPDVSWDHRGDANQSRRKGKEYSDFSLSSAQQSPNIFSHWLTQKTAYKEVRKMYFSWAKDRNASETNGTNEWHMTWNKIWSLRLFSCGKLTALFLIHFFAVVRGSEAFLLRRKRNSYLLILGKGQPWTMSPKE